MEVEIDRHVSLIEYFVANLNKEIEMKQQTKWFGDLDFVNSISGFSQSCVKEPEIPNICGNLTSVW